MRHSKKRLAFKKEKEIINFLYQVVADIRNQSEAATFIDEILTSAEKEAIAKRLAVARQLEKGDSYEEIKQALKVSSATVAGIADQLKTGCGYQLALKKIDADEWADRVVGKINQMMPRSR